MSEVKTDSVTKQYKFGHIRLWYLNLPTDLEHHRIPKEYFYLQCSPDLVNVTKHSMKTTHKVVYDGFIMQLECDKYQTERVMVRLGQLFEICNSCNDDILNPVSTRIMTSDHTSMSTGDIIEFCDLGTFHLCTSRGWKEIV